MGSIRMNDVVRAEKNGLDIVHDYKIGQVLVQVQNEDGSLEIVGGLSEQLWFADRDKAKEFIFKIKVGDADDNCEIR
jgi:hypothetical protein